MVAFPVLLLWPCFGYPATGVTEPGESTRIRILHCAVFLIQIAYRAPGMQESENLACLRCPFKGPRQRPTKGLHILTDFILCFARLYSGFWPVKGPPLPQSSSYTTRRDSFSLNFSTFFARSRQADREQIKSALGKKCFPIYFRFAAEKPFY